MQRSTITLRLSGDLKNTVQKSGVSPAEIVILRDLHGEGSVVDIQPNGMDKDSHSKERGRLAGIYGHHVIDRIFPGEWSRLPVSLKDIEPRDESDEEEEDEEETDQGEGGEGGAKTEAEDPEAAKRAADAERKRLSRARAAAEKATTVDELKAIAAKVNCNISGETETVENLKEALKAFFGPASE